MGRALVDHAGALGQQVTLRVQVTDSNGNSVTQTVDAGVRRALTHC